MMFCLQINKFLCAILYFFDVFIFMSKVPRYIAIKYMCEILCMSTLSRQKIKANNDLNAMYVDTVNMQRKYTKLDYICLFIYYVDTVDTTFTEYTRSNRTYVDRVDMIKLQCKF